MNKKILGILICMLLIVVGAVPYISGNNIENTPPSTPACSWEPSNWTMDVYSTDAESDQIRYGVSWWDPTTGLDTNIDQWTSYYNSGVEVKIDCKGQKEKFWLVAEDIYGAQSKMINPESKMVIVLSDGKSIEHPIFNSFFEKLFEHFPFFEKILNQIYYN
ncbi:MAG: hypothetical protein MUO82_05260 [Candidatus Thermoplasmatota archaeon]|nr:hypothetical protein [Candidatus Thermoplasmatota archaeon]